MTLRWHNSEDNCNLVTTLYPDRVIGNGLRIYVFGCVTVD